jgi:hypothetical protein
MSTRALNTSTYVRPDTERMCLPAKALTWAICLGMCVAFWWLVLTALLG